MSDLVWNIMKIDVLVSMWQFFHAVLLVGWILDVFLFYVFVLMNNCVVASMWCCEKYK